MIDTALFGKLAGGISIAAYLPYIWAILKYRNDPEKRVTPNRASWTIWTIVSGIIWASYTSSGATDTAWVPAGYTIGSFIVSLLSIKFGEGGWAKLDRNCFVAAGIGLMLWWAFDSPLYTLFTSLSVDIVASFPTIKKVWINPKSEDKLAWLLFWGGSLANVLAVNKWAFVIYVYPVAMFVLITLITGLILWDKERPKLTPSPMRIVKAD
ncbi:MAG: hypothetical protein ACKKL6_04125 [Candidatus Komeilibacteria bacterium]